jgi:hypothetical protein
MISEETRRRMSESAKRRVARDGPPKGSFKKGHEIRAPEEAIQRRANTQRGQKREGNWDSPTRWKGEGNPWHGKTRSGKVHPRWNEARHRRDYKNYVNRVLWLSEKSYELNKSTINPENHPRGLCGQHGAYQLDHKIPVRRLGAWYSTRSDGNERESSNVTLGTECCQVSSC